MEYFENSLESLKLQNIYLELDNTKEGHHVWKNLIRIEELKRENLRRKNAQMRQNIQKITIF